MGSIVLQGREPFDLIAHRLATAVAESKTVAATVPIFAPGFPGNIAEIRILLNPQQAEDLARQLHARGEKGAGEQGMKTTERGP